MATRKTRNQRRLDDLQHTEPIIDEIAGITERLRTHKGWSYMPERLTVLKAQLANRRAR